MQECWRMGLASEARQLLQKLTELRKAAASSSPRRKRNHDAMLGLHGLPELAMAMCVQHNRLLKL